MRFLNQRKNVFILSGIIFVLISGIFLTLYIGIHQVLREGANDPQIAINEDIVRTLNGETVPDAFSELDRDVDVMKSLKPFFIIYDASSTPLAGSAKLDGILFVPPRDVFLVAKEKGENRITLEPKEGIRLAAIIKPFSNGEASGFVLTARSLKEVEARTKIIGMAILLMWVISLIFVVIASLLLSRQKIGITSDK